MKYGIPANPGAATIALCVVLATYAQTPAHSVMDVQVSSSETSTQISIRTAGKVDFRYNRLSNPDRIYLDLLNTTSEERQIAVADSVVQQVRVGGSEPTVTRVVLDLTARAEFDVTQVEGPDRVVIDIREPLLRRRIRDIQVSDAGDESRIVIETTSRVDIESHLLLSPARIYIDFPDTAARTGQIEIGSPLVSRVRVAYTQPTVTRVVVDLTGPAEFQTSWMENPSRLLVAIRPEGSVSRPAVTPAAVPIVTEIPRSAPEPPSARIPVSEPTVPAEPAAPAVSGPQQGIPPRDVPAPSEAAQAEEPARPQAVAPVEAPTPPEPAPPPKVAEARIAERKAAAARPVQAAPTVVPSPAPQAGTVFNADGKLLYQIHWPTGITQGEASLETSAGGAVIEFRFDASLPGVPVNGQFQSRLNPDGCTQVFSKKYAFGFRTAQETETIANGQLERKTGDEGGTSTSPAGSCLYDALAFVNFLRQELAAGRTPTGRRILFGAQYDLSLKPLDAGAEDVDRFEFSVKGPASSHTFEIDFKRDPLRTPARVRIPMPLGQFVLGLVE